MSSWRTMGAVGASVAVAGGVACALWRYLSPSAQNAAQETDQDTDQETEEEDTDEDLSTSSELTDETNIGKEKKTQSFEREQVSSLPEYVELGEFVRLSDEEHVYKCTAEGGKVPHFNALVYLANKKQLGRVVERFTQRHDVYFSVRPSENMKESSIKKYQKIYIDPVKLMSPQTFAPRPTGKESSPQGDRGGGRGGAGGGTRGGGSCEGFGGRGRSFGGGWGFKGKGFGRRGCRGWR